MYTIDKLLNDLENVKVESESNVELEARFQGITYDQFCKLLNHLLNVEHKVEITKSVVSIIREGETIGTLMELLFPNTKNEKVKKQWKRKTIVLEPFYDNSMIIPYKLTAATEEIIDSCNMDSADMIRIKIRYSFTLNAFPNWTYDLTIMRQLTGESAKSSLKTIVNNMFNHNLAPKDVIKSLNLDQNNNLYNYEIEAEYHGSTVTKESINNVISYVINNINESYKGSSQFNQLIKEVADSIGYNKQLYRYTLKEILPQVELLTKDIYCKLYPPKNMYITDKADGTRCIIVVKESQLYILTDTYTIHKLDIDPEFYCICDCEYVESIAYVFDVMNYNNDSIIQKGYGERIKHIDDIINTINCEYVRSKQIYNEISYIDNALKPDQPYETDGLIFIENNASYINTKSYKWKPLEHTTIDFLAKKATGPIPNVTVKPGHELYILFNGVSAENFLMMGMRTINNYKKMFPFTSKSYFPVQFSPSTNPYAYVYQHPIDSEDIDSKVIELRLINYDITKLPYLPEWQLIRIRNDRQTDVDSGKYFGNDFRVAELTWNIFLDPLTLDELVNGCSKSYFIEQKGTMYFAQVNVLSFVKEKRIEQYANTEWVIDACSGRGADLGRFLKNNIKNLVCIDQDRAALSELVKRKYDFLRIMRKNQKKPHWAKKQGTSVYVIVSDFADKKQVIQKTKTIIPKDGVNLITCNFAVHYFMESTKTMNNFAILCKSLLKKGGTITLTFMIGELLFDLLKEVNYEETIDTYDHVIKNSIKKLYTEDILLPAGQKIGVLLPFSQGEYYTEYLVNTEALIDTFVSHGFTCSKVIPVKNSIPSFKHERPNIYNLLTIDDKWYLELFGELIITAP